MKLRANILMKQVTHPMNMGKLIVKLMREEPINQQEMFMRNHPLKNHMNRNKHSDRIWEGTNIKSMEISPTQLSSIQS